MSELRPLWTCPECGNAFVNRNNWHSCVSVPLEVHFGQRPKARELFELFQAEVEKLGPVTLVSSKTRLGFMTRVRFVGIHPRRDGLEVVFWLVERRESPRVHRIESIPPRNFIHYVAIREPSDIDEEVRGLLKAARAVGDQQHHDLYRMKPKA